MAKARADRKAREGRRAVFTKALQQRVDTGRPLDRFEVLIHLRPTGHRREGSAAKQRKAFLSQEQAGRLLELLEKHREDVEHDGKVSVPLVERVRELWVAGVVSARVTLRMLQELRDQADQLNIEAIDVERKWEWEDVLSAPGPARRAPRPGRKSARKGSAPTPLRRRARTAGVDLPHVAAVNAPLVWKLGVRGKGVVVAVVDTGVNYQHPDLEKRMWPGLGRDFLDWDADPMDSYGHGTRCAGIIAGDGTAGQATGIAPEASIMALRVGPSEPDCWDAFQFAMENGAHIVSVSLCFPWYTKDGLSAVAWRTASESLLAAGVVLVAAAGNEGTDPAPPYNIGMPGDCPPPWLHPSQVKRGETGGTITCGAVALSGDPFGGRGPVTWVYPPYDDYPHPPGLLKPDICAPGAGTVTCNHRLDESTYAHFGATSAATANVAGCLALLASACIAAGQPVSPALLDEAIERSARSMAGQAAGKKKNGFGAGHIDVYAAHGFCASRQWR